MNSQRFDASIREKIAPCDIAEYIQRRGGKQRAPFKNGSIWDFKGEEFLLPSFHTRDYALVIYFIIQQLEEIQKIDKAEIYTSLLNPSHDIIHIYFSSSKEQYTFSAEEDILLLQNAYHLLYSSACFSAAQKQQYKENIPLLTEKYMKNVRFGYSEYGCHIPPLLAPTSSLFTTHISSCAAIDTPYEDTVVPRLQQALLALYKASLEAQEISSVQPFLAAAQAGVTATLCNAVSTLQDIYRDGNIRITLSYALRRVMPKEEITIDIPNKASKYIKEAAIALKKW